MYTNFTNGIESNRTLSSNSHVELKVHEVMKRGDVFNDFKQYIRFKHSGMLVMSGVSLVVADHIGCFWELDRQSWWVLLMQKTV